MRLIDADKLYPDRMTNKGTVAISQSQIANAKTVEAVPLSVIEKIRAEIEKAYKHQRIVQGTKWTNGLLCAAEIIDRKIADAKGDKA